MDSKYKYTYEKTANYCYEGTDTLINKLNITNDKDLFNAERELVSFRTYELNEKPLKGNFDFDYLKKIHKYLFQDIYRWAGNIRNCNIAKQDLFCLSEYIETFGTDIFNKLKEENYFVYYDNELTIEKLVDLFADINALHPFRDGNGRTSRLLANYILKAYGYDLKGFYVMEEFYDKNINDYYNSLQMGLHHNFYFGRKDADITEWLEYFISTMANTFEAVGNRVKEIYLNSKEEVNILDTLDKRERWIANYILNNGKIKAKDIASHFKISLNTANNWIKEWLENGFLVRENDKQIRNVDYILTKKYQEKIK